LKHTRIVFVALVLVALPVAAFAGDNAETIFKAKCVMCHGADGAGQTPAGQKLGAADLRSADVQKQTDTQLEEVIANGRKKMPGYAKTLKPADIKGLVAYVRNLAKSK
jgi:cytochrome c6